MSKQIAWMLVPIGVVVGSVVSASSVADSDLADTPAPNTRHATADDTDRSQPSPFLAPDSAEHDRPGDAEDGILRAAVHFAPYRAPTPLDPFFEQLERVDTGEGSRVGIVQLGDSHTASDAFSGRVRRALQTRFGAAGRGLTHPGRPWPSFRQEQMSWGMSRGWTARLATDTNQTEKFGLGGVRLKTDSPGAWIERSTCEHCEVGRRFDSFAVHYLRQPGGGRLEVSVDGRTVGSTSTAGALSLGILRGTVASGSHTLRATVDGGGPVSLLGIRTQSRQPGVEYTSLGLNGATAADYTNLESTIAADELRALDPDLVVFAFGTNGAYNLHRFAEKYADNPKAVAHKKRRWARHYRDLVSTTMERTDDDTACLVVTPPDLATGSCRWHPDSNDEAPACVRRPPMFDFVVDVQRHTADTAGCATWNQAQAMGGPGSIDRWADRDPQLAKRDGKHLTFEGYKALGSRFYADLMAAYEAYQNGRSLQLRARPVETTPRGLGAAGP